MQPPTHPSNRLEAGMLSHLNMQSIPAGGRHPGLLVERHHTAGDGHVAGHLGRHAAEQHHLLARVRVEGGVVQGFGPPQLVLGELQRFAGPDRRENTER